MASDAGLFITDCQGKRTIHLQGCNSSSAYFRLAPERDASPTKMVRPAILPRIEYRCWLTGLWVREELSGALMQRAGYARESQIAGRCRAACRNGDNVIDVKRGDLPHLRQTAVLAAIACSSNDPLAQISWNIAHRYSRLAARRVLPAGAAATRTRPVRPNLPPHVFRE